MPRENKVIVEGVNIAKKHVKAGRGMQAGIIEKAMPLHASNVMVICTECGKPTRIGHERVPRGRIRRSGYAGCASSAASPFRNIRGTKPWQHSKCRDSKSRYLKEIVPALRKEFGYANIMQAPAVHKIVINIGMGEAIQNAKAMDNAVRDLSDITGQRPVITKARHSVASFKLREGMPIGCTVTLRGDPHV